MGWFNDLTGLDTPDWVKDAGAVIANPTVAFYDAQAGAATGKGAQTPGGKVLQDPVADMMGLAGLNNLGGPGGDNVHTITNAPWYAIQPSLIKGIGTANEIAYGDDKELDIPDYLAPSSMTMSGLRAFGAGPSEYLDSAGKFYKTMLKGEKNPYLDSTFNKSADAVRQRLDSQFAAAGRYGADAHQNVMSDAYNDLATQVYGGAYENDMNRRMQALGMAPELDAAIADAALRRYQAGALLDDMRENRRDYQYDAEMERLDRYLQQINAAGGNYGTQSQPIYENDTASLIGLLSGVGSLLGGIGSL